LTACFNKSKEWTYEQEWQCVRIHQTLRITPAMAAGVTDRVWEIADIVRMLEDQKPTKDRDARAEWKLGSASLR
jgi:hypothetical protein